MGGARGGRRGEGEGGAGASTGPDWFRQWEQSVTQWWDAVLEDPRFVKGMGDSLAGTAEVRSAWESGVDDTMHRMHLPAKSDVVRLARVASLLEDRLVALEDQVAESSARLERIEKEMLRARVDAATALVELRELADVLRARLPEPVGASR